MLQLIPRDQIRQLHPAVIPRELPVEWEDAIIKGELIAVLLCGGTCGKLGAAFGSIQPICGNFTAIEVPRFSAPQAIWRSSGSPTLAWIIGIAQTDPITIGLISNLSQQFVIERNA